LLATATTAGLAAALALSTAAAQAAANGTWLSQPQIWYYASRQSLNDVMAEIRGSDFKVVFLDVRKVSEAMQREAAQAARRQGLLPEVLGKIHPRRHTPHLAILVLFVIVSLLILSGGVKPLAEATVLLLLVVFTLVNVSLIVLKRREGEPTDGFDVPLLVPILGALVCTLLVVVRVQAAFTDPKPGAAVAPLIALAIFAVSFGLYFRSRVSR